MSLGFLVQVLPSRVAARMLNSALCIAPRTALASPPTTAAHALAPPASSTTAASTPRMAGQGNVPRPSPGPGSPAVAPPGCGAGLELAGAPPPPTAAPAAAEAMGWNLEFEDPTTERAYRLWFNASQALTGARASGAGCPSSAQDPAHPQHPSPAPADLAVFRSYTAMLLVLVACLVWKGDLDQCAGLLGLQGE